LVAERQHGVVATAQLRRRGVAKAVIHRAVRSGWLHEVHRGVYSIVPPALMTVEAWHAAAILAGGEGACLCSHSAAWWAGLVKERPAEIHVAIAGERQPVAGVRWHRLALAPGEREKHRGMPVTALTRIPSDLAPSMTVFELKGVLAELEYHYGIEPAEVMLLPGRTGAPRLRRALADHTPQLAATRSHLERAFADFLTSRNFALPEFNHPFGTSTVDAIYRDQRVVIELDGLKGHRGERRILRDHRRDLHRRADGLLPIRYHYSQVMSPVDQILIEAELDRLGIPRRT
jgi:very-short-patch-repair endonuclease